MAKGKEEIKVSPVTNVNGTPVVSFEDQRDAAEEIMKNDLDIGMREYKADGTMARTYYVTAAVNFDQFYDNRYRVKNDEMQMVIAQTTDGYRAIKEQATGRVFQKQVPIYVFARIDGKLQFVRLDVVSDTEFISEFTHKLGQDAMRTVLPLIPVDTSINEETLPI